ncbi:hypothetical protein AOLI_G00313360 [Acnodon oligacanthus]
MPLPVGVDAVCQAKSCSAVGQARYSEGAGERVCVVVCCEAVRPRRSLSGTLARLLPDSALMEGLESCLAWAEAF